MSYDTATCVRCGSEVIADEGETRSLCYDCVRVEEMQKRRQGNVG